MDSQCYLCPHKGLYIFGFNDTCSGSMEYCKMNQTPPYCTRYNFTPPAPTTTVDYLTKMNYDLSEENKRLREQIEDLGKKLANTEKDKDSLKKIVSKQLEAITNQVDMYNDLDRKYVHEIQQNAELVAHQAPHLKDKIKQLYDANRQLRDLRDDLSSDNAKLKTEIQELKDELAQQKSIYDALAKKYMDLVKTNADWRFAR